MSDERELPTAAVLITEEETICEDEAMTVERFQNHTPLEEAEIIELVRRSDVASLIRNKMYGLREGRFSKEAVDDILEEILEKVDVGGETE